MNVKYVCILFIITLFRLENNSPNTAGLTFPPLSPSEWTLPCSLMDSSLTNTHTPTCLARKATISQCRSLAPRQVQYLWVGAAFYRLSLTKMISISGTLSVNPAALQITSAVITDSPAGCHCVVANKLRFPSQG